MGVTWSQFFPPQPTLTEKNLPNQHGKVFIVTGGTSGVGFELCSILYRSGGRVYLAGRSEERAQAAIASIKSQPCSAPGELILLLVSLEDLTTIKSAVDRFTQAETRLDVLFNNAGVSNPPHGIKSAQGHEMQMATNYLGPYLLTKFLVPTLLSTAKSSSSPGAVRIVWTSSIVVDIGAPKGGLVETDLTSPPQNPQRNYTTSKIGNWFLAEEFARQVGDKGVLSLTQNPGNLHTSLLRHLPAIIGWIVAPLLHHARFGAYTELWAGLSDELGAGDGGAYVIPWGRRHPNPREDLLMAMKMKEEGGTGQSKAFAEFCERQTERFL